MRTNHRTRRSVLSALAAGAAALSLLAIAGPAGARIYGDKVGPNQWFSAEVNGSLGLSHPVAIQMACFGPIKPGETGHPFAGQTVAVSRAVAILTTDGYTGPQGTEIGAFFGPPPPTAPPPSGPVYFHRYGSMKIPTSEVLPCGGSGQVTFVPIPFLPPSTGALGPKDDVVPVEYVGQP